ncbi:MAG: uridine kinase [Bdellovibrionia bacterium]
MTGSTRPNKPFVLGVAGGSGSGKTYFARAVWRALGADNCEIILQDNFYHDQSAKFDRDGGSVNFDHPDAIDFALLASCLKVLREGEPVEIPLYDFAKHTRKKEKELITPKPILIVDGILILHSPVARATFDEAIFFDMPEELRFKRRLERDVRERGRTRDGVKAQWESQVKPMHDKFVAPSKAHAARVVNDLGKFEDLLMDYVPRFRKRVINSV